MERRFLKPLTEWSLTDVEALIDERIREGQRLDYKEALPLDREKDRAEVAKDVTGMANAQGGLLVYGVKEDDSEEPVPETLTPLDRLGQQTRLEDILDSGAVHPRPDYQALTLDAEDGSVILVRVAQRSGGPLMIQGYKQHRYFVRRGLRTVPMTEDEVRAAYATASLAAQSVGDLIRSLPILPRITRTRSVDEIQMRANGILKPSWFPLVSVVTAPVSGPDELMAPHQTSASGFPEPSKLYLGPGRRLRSEGYFQIDACGLLEERLAGDPGEASEISATEPPRVVANRFRIYRQGVLEWAHRYLVNDEYGIPSTSFGQDVHNAIVYAAEIYSTLGYYGPVALWVRIDNAESARLDVPQRFFEMQHARPTGMESINAYKEVSVDLMLRDPLSLMRNAMERIWQGFGYTTCLLFDEDGNWTGPQ